MQRASSSYLQRPAVVCAGYHPEEAFRAGAESGAIFGDIRPEGQRAKEGSVLGAVVVERNVLEWRFDPCSSSRLPIATDHDIQVIMFCFEDYTSSLAAAALQEIGLGAPRMLSVDFKRGEKSAYQSFVMRFFSTR